MNPVADTGSTPGRSTIVVVINPALPAPDLSRPLTEVFDLYRAARRLGPEARTLSNYELAWNGLVDSLRRSLGREPVAADVSTISVNRHLAKSAEDRGLGEQTLATYGGNIRSVVSGCATLNLLPDTALLGFKVPKVTSRPIVSFEAETLARIFDRLEAERTAKNIRMRAFANIMLDCGARPEEVGDLLFEDLFEGSSEIRLDGKGSKVRIVPVGAETWAYMKDYMRVRPAPASLGDRVFTGLRDAGTGNVATAVATDFRALLVALGIVGASGRVSTRKKGRACLYTLRKTFGHRAASGMDVARLMAIMGHSPNSLTMVLLTYYQVTDKQKREAHAAARPADGLHEWRARPGRTVEEPSRALSFFERYASPSRTDGGRRPASKPSSRSRTSGA